MISFLRRLRNFINRKHLNLIYQTVILPHLDYADIIWQSSSEQLVNQLQKLQNRAGRIILKINPQSHFSVASMHEILKWQTLKSRQTFHAQVMMFKVLNNLTPSYLQENIFYSHRPYRLRHHNLSLPKPRTNSCKRTFFYRGAKLHNSLPTPIRNCQSLTLFKRSLAN